MPIPHAKLAQTAARVTRFQYSPYKNGARNAPASAPQEMPISCAINCAIDFGGNKASTTEQIIKKIKRIRIHKSCFLSLIFLMILSFKKSSVSVELDVNTSEDNVDIEAESTSTITMPTSKSGKVDSMAGIIASKITLPSSLWIAAVSNSLPNPPKK